MNHVRHTCSGRDDLPSRLAEIANHEVRLPRPGERQEIVEHRRGRDPDQAVAQKMLKALPRGQSGKL